MIVAGFELTSTTSYPSSRRALQACVPGVIELACLADDDRAGADEQNLVNVVATRHVAAFQLETCQATAGRRHPARLDNQVKSLDVTMTGVRVFKWPLACSGEL